MRVMTILNDLFSSCRDLIDIRVLQTLLSSVEALSRSRKLTLAGIGRSLNRQCSVKNKIKAIDRLFGNSKLQKVTPLFYKNIINKIIAPQSHPIIIVDGSGFSHCGKYHFLRAAVPLGGRAIPIFEMAVEAGKINHPKTHQIFLKHLKSILPRDCVPIIVTDAGFRNPWFKLILSFNWDYVGRIRNKTACCNMAEKQWLAIKTLYLQAKKVPTYLGKYWLARRKSLETYLYVYQEKKKNRVRRNLMGKKIQSSMSLKHAKRGSEPWLLASSLFSEAYSAKAIVNIYKKRMQIEESFRDLKNGKSGFSLRQNRSIFIERLNIILLIGAITMFLLWILGTIVKNKKIHYQYQANTIRNRTVLSNFMLGWQVIEEKRYKFRKNEIIQAIKSIKGIICT